MPPILDAAIGTVFVFLLFSLVISALNEYILSLTDQRAKFLRLGLVELFGQKVASTNKREKFWTGGLFGDGKEDLGAVGNQLLGHGLINAFSRSDVGTSPSYIPAGAFVTGLLDVVVGKPSTRWNPAEATLLANLITAIRGANPVTLTTYSAALTTFTTAYRALTPAPAVDSLLAKFHYRVADALARPEPPAGKTSAQRALTGAADFAAALALIPNQPAPLQPILSAISATASEDLNVLKQLLEKFDSPVMPVEFQTELTTLEEAAADSLALAVRPALEHTAEAIEASLHSLPSSKLKESLISLFRAAGGDVKQFKLAIEGWFNGVMDRVSGWYKNFSQKWMVVLGLILAAAFNVDTIEIVRVLSNNPNLARAVADHATTYVSAEKKPFTAAELEKQRNGKLDAVVNASTTLKDLKVREADTLKQLQLAEEKFKNAAGDQKSAASTEVEQLKATRAGIPEQLQKAEKALEEAAADADTLAKYNASVAKLHNAGLPIGWTKEKFTLVAFLVAIPGWFLTAVAASLGAPFWFDLLGRFVNVRASGKAPGEKESTSSPSKPRPASLDTTP